MRLFHIALLSSVLLPAPALPQTHAPSSFRDSIDAAARSAQIQAPAGRDRDSLTNGAIIGALVGGATIGGVGLYVCEVLREPGNPPCWRVLGVAAVAAGIGAAAGAGIDALISPSAPARPRRMEPAGGITLRWRHSF